MLNKSLKVSAVAFMPFVIIENGTVIDGVDVRILQEVIKDRQIKIKYQLFPDWNSAIDDLVKGSSDISIGAHWLLSAAKSNLSMSIPYSQTCQSLLVPKPRLLPQETYVFQPLQAILWVILPLLISTLAVILTHFNLKFKIEPMSFLDNLLHIFQELTLSGGYRHFRPATPKGVIFIRIFWSFIALLISTFYASGFASILTYPRLTKPIKTIDDLVASKLIYAHTIGDEVNIMLKSSDARISKFFEKFQSIRDFEERQNAVRKYKYAFSTQILAKGIMTEMNQFDSSAKTYLKLLSECLFVTSYVVVLRKNSPFAKEFNRVIRKLVENGLIKCWTSKMRLKYGEKEMMEFFARGTKSNQKSKPLDLERIQGAFYVYILGNCFGVCLFGIEYYFSRIV